MELEKQISPSNVVMIYQDLEQDNLGDLDQYSSFDNNKEELEMGMGQRGVMRNISMEMEADDNDSFNGDFNNSFDAFDD